MAGWVPLSDNCILGWCDRGQSQELRVSNHLTRTVIVPKGAACGGLLLLSNEISPGKTGREADLAPDWPEYPGTVSAGCDITDRQTSQTWVSLEHL